MKNYSQIYALFLMSVFHTSCGQNQTNLPQDNVSKGLYSESQLKEAETSNVPMSMVRHVRQARNGDILVASFRGVFRYDGKSFTNLTSTIPSPSFWDVLEDRKGNLWFASRDSGVYFYNGKYFQHLTTKEGLADNMVFSIYEDEAGNIWFGGGVLSRYDGKSFQNFTMKDGLPHNGGRAIMEDKTGKVWIATLDGPCFYDPSTERRSDPFRAGEKTFTALKNKDGKAFKNVWSIIKDEKGSIWFGDVDGLWRYDGSTFTNVSQRGASAIIEDKKGNIWTTGEEKPNGVWTWKLLRYDQKSLYNKNPAVTEIMSTEKMLCGILEAKDGSIWFGSLFGVYRYDGKTITDFKSKGGQ